MEVKEDLLQFIWNYRLFDTPLRDLDEVEVELIDPGQHNRDSGPDFFNARIRSEGILWAGNIEIHKKASEWYQHGHHLDAAFDNVILHVVMEPDCEVRNSSGRVIRTARMGIAPEIIRRYGLLMNNPGLIPCWRNVLHVDRGRLNLWLERLAVERLEERTRRVMEDLERCSWDWQEVLYLSMARAFGQRVNADPFEMLARSVTLKQIREDCPDQLSREALLFGQAGMLVGQNGMIEAAGDAYYTELCQLYKVLKRSSGLQPIDGFLWKFLRLRPDNFPTIRISQLAYSLGKYPDLFEELVGADDPLDFALKMEIRASEYWTTHYRFGHESPAREKHLGKSRMRGLFINAFMPVLFAFRRMDRSYPMRPGNGCLKEWDFHELMRRMPAEDNRIIRMWKGLGLEVPDVLASQAILQLVNNYCKFKSCLSCYVGSQIINTSPEEN